MAGTEAQESKWGDFEGQVAKEIGTLGESSSFCRTQKTLKMAFLPLLFPLFTCCLFSSDGLGTISFENSKLSQLCKGEQRAGCSVLSSFGVHRCSAEEAAGQRPGREGHPRAALQPGPRTLSRGCPVCSSIVAGLLLCRKRH